MSHHIRIAVNKKFIHTELVYLLINYYFVSSFVPKIELYL